jgi:hypothetical protein
LSALRLKGDRPAARTAKDAFTSSTEALVQHKGWRIPWVALLPACSNWLVGTIVHLII